MIIDLCNAWFSDSIYTVGAHKKLIWRICVSGTKSQQLKAYRLRDLRRILFVIHKLTHPFQPFSSINISYRFTRIPKNGNMTDSNLLKQIHKQIHDKIIHNAIRISVHFEWRLDKSKYAVCSLRTLSFCRRELDMNSIHCYKCNQLTRRGWRSHNKVKRTSILILLFWMNSDMKRWIHSLHTHAQTS